MLLENLFIVSVCAEGRQVSALDLVTGLGRWSFVNHMGIEQRYISYLLRLWQTKNRGELIWRASLESPHTDECKSFANLTDLFTFLEQKTGHRIRGQTIPNADEKGGDTEQINS
jgi:hypothetical protein